MTKMNEVDQLAVVIRDSICKISERAPSNARSVIDQYLPIINRNKANQGDSALPFNPRRSSKNPERCGVDVTLPYSLLCFHIGNAVMAYYDSVKTNIATPELKIRSKFLSRVAEVGMTNYSIDGSLTEGFYLSCAADKLEKLNVPTPNEAETGGKVNPGGGDSQRLPPPFQRQPESGKAD